MKIVCGVDFSSWSQAAARTAATLASARGDLVFLTYVLEPHLESLDAPTRQRLETQHRERLQLLANQLSATTHARIEALVVSGQSDQALRRCAAERDVGLIVVGSAGHSASALVRLGGTSERLAAGSSIPVLVIRDDTPFAQWAEKRGLRILVGFNGDEASRSALRWVEQLRRIAPVDVVLGRVYYQDEAHRQYGLTRRFSYTDPDSRVEAFIERDLKAQVPGLEGSGEVLYRAKLAVGRVVDHLLELGEAERCQLVVVGTHGRTGLARMWSVSSAALHLSRMSVAVVPADGQQAQMARPRLKRVLVSTDFSELANAAIPWAYTLCEEGGEVILTHVTLTTGMAGELVDQYLPSTELVAQPPLRVELEVAARLRALTPPIAAQKGIITTTEVIRAPQAGQAIRDAAERFAADAIVLASHGRTGLMQTLLGSVAEQVLKKSRKPVFLIRDGALHADRVR